MLDDRFWTKVDKRSPTECWEWNSNKNNKGYGLFKVSAAVGNKLAHRLAFEDKNGRLAKGALVLHSCDNRLCVNPSHLRAGTHKDNVSDMDLRGRRVPPGLHGEAVPSSKFTENLIIRVRNDYVSGASAKTISVDHRIPLKSLPDILSGRSWHHLFGRDGHPSLEQLKQASARETRKTAKLTYDQAQQIRQRLAAGERGASIAASFKVSAATVSHIKAGKKWPVTS